MTKQRKKKTTAGPPPEAGHAGELSLEQSNDIFQGLDTRLETILEIRQLLYLPKGASIEDHVRKAARAIELFESITPTDGAETMLAQQMVGTHLAAMECLARAATPELNFAGINLAMKHAQSLLALYVKQMEVLNRYRGRGHQKVTVEHVHVEAGGQAIVGTVEVEAVRPAPERHQTNPQGKERVPASEALPQGEAHMGSMERKRVLR